MSRSGRRTTAGAVRASSVGASPGFSDLAAMTILEGSTFCLSDDRGDFGGHSAGLFADDTRMLSTFRLRIDGEAPLLLTSARTDYFAASFYLRNAPTSTLPPDTLFITRERYVERGLVERLVLQNERNERLAFDVELEARNDFADIISVKAYDYALGHPDAAPPLPEEHPPTELGPRRLRFDDAESGMTSWLLFSRDVRYEDGRCSFAVELAGHDRWQLVVEVLPAGTDKPPEAAREDLHFGSELEHVRASLWAWNLRVPGLRTSNEAILQCYHRSLADLASLRIRGVDTVRELPAAGMPWFMTIFGRDTIITCLETLLFGPELAHGALESLAALQAAVDDPSIDAEPGKILHELRRGTAARTWFPIYYGAVDTTPLFLILLSELWRWTGVDELVRSMREPALAALEWIDRFGDRDGDGFVEYERRGSRGLENQSWKDSGDSQRFHDGTCAVPPIAPAEVQGYVFDAKRRSAELARKVWGDEALGARLDGEADELQRRFDDAFWIERRGGFYALALDGAKRQVDSLCSNMGHLLWSGIVPEHRRADVAARLLGDQLWSGWGIRTMSSSDAAYNPLSYHTGTVWPHDTMLGAWGLALSDRWEDAYRVCRGLLDGAASFDWSLPEVFAGIPRADTALPIAYPVAARPQAWASGAPVLALQVLLGLRPDVASGRLVSDAPTPLPEWVGDIHLHGVHCLGSSWNVDVEGGELRVVPA